MKKGMIGFLTAVIGATIGGIGVNYIKNKKLFYKEDKIDKFKGYYYMLNQWLLLKNEGKNLEQYFTQHGYRSVAVYGMGEMGNRLYEELKDTCIDVKYAIDKNAESTYSELQVYNMDDSLEEVDVVVVTATFAYDEIVTELSKIINYPVVSLEDIIYEC